MVHCEVDGAVAWLTLDNPPVNQLDAPARAGLLQALARLAADPAVRVLILTGAGGRAFCAGNDLKELAALPPESVAAFAAEWDRLYRALREFPRPVIAAVNGHAMGGGFEIMLNCDLRLVAETAAMACTAAQLGLVTSTYSLARHLPPALAKELFLTARRLTAQEALTLGLVNRVVPAERLLAEAGALAAAIAAQPPLALTRGKQLIDAAAAMERDAHDALQQAAFVELFATPEHHAAVRRFWNRG